MKICVKSLNPLCTLPVSEFHTPSFWPLPGHSALYPWETPASCMGSKVLRIEGVIMCQPYLSPPGAQGFCLGHDNKKGHSLETGANHADTDHRFLLISQFHWSTFQQCCFQGEIIDTGNPFGSRKIRQNNVL